MEVKRRHAFQFRLPELVLCVLLIFSGVNLALSSGGFVDSFQRVGFTVFSTLQNGVHAVADGLVSTVNAVHELSRLKTENRILEEQLKNYEYFQRNNTEIRKENERLKEQLAFATSLEQKNYPAQIIGRNPDSLYSGLDNQQGQSQRNQKNMPVLAVQRGNVGLVGKVVTVGLGTSIVMPVYDLKCNVSARIQNTRDVGIVSGLGSADVPLALRYIKKRVLEELHYGDIIVTSGETENFPRDIPIGTISRISVLDYDSSLNIEVVPAVDFSRLETVVVVDLHEVNPAAGMIPVQAQ